MSDDDGGQMLFCELSQHEAVKHIDNRLYNIAGCLGFIHFGSVHLSAWVRNMMLGFSILVIILVDSDSTTTVKSYSGRQSITSIQIQFAILSQKFMSLITHC